jgi:hypothetical protein
MASHHPVPRWETRRSRATARHLRARLGPSIQAGCSQ